MRSAARRRFLRVAVCRERIDEAEMRRQYGLAPDEPLPDSSSSSATSRAYFTQFVSPLGTYFDAYELHLLASTAIDGLRRRHPDAGVDVRRFRPPRGRRRAPLPTPPPAATFVGVASLAYPEMLVEIEVTAVRG